jgi:Cdc6-like AAA superfamily ATPase
MQTGENTSNFRQFRYDFVAHDSVSQEHFFKGIGLDGNIRKLFDGYNTTVFAYGPTGSGKTFTMHGVPSIDSSVG